MTKADNLKHLAAKYFKAKDAYYAGEPIMSDSDFDALEDVLYLEAPELIANAIGAPERGKKVKLPAPMGSLDQIHNQSELRRWESKYPIPTPTILTDKIDGNSCLIQYTNHELSASFSRGDGIEGANNFRHISRFNCIPCIIGKDQPADVLIRGEIVISKENWINHVQPFATNRAGKSYANSRNFVAGFLNGKLGEYVLYKYFHFVAYEVLIPGMSKREQLAWLENQGFITPNYRFGRANFWSYSQFEDIAREMIAASPYELDGIVIDIDSASQRDTEVDLDDLNPSHARKLKLINDAEVATTTVTKLEWNVSKDGFLKPLVYFEPISLVGATITKATGHNARNISNLGIGPGAVVQIVRSGDVIPKIIGCTTSVPFVQPENSEWNATGADLVSTSVDTMREMVQQQLEHFFLKLDVEYMGAGNIRKMIDAGMFSDPVSAIITPDACFTQVLGATGTKAARSFREKLANTTPHDLFAAFDVLGRGVGSRRLKSLFDAVDFEQFIGGKVTTEQIVAIPGFDEKTAAKLLSGYEELNAMYQIVKNDVTFVKSVAASNTTGRFAGQVFCATGVRLSPEQIALVNQHGGEVADSFGSKVTTLIAKDPSASSSKLDKARAKGVNVISLNQFSESLA